MWYLFSLHMPLRCLCVKSTSRFSLLFCLIYFHVTCGHSTLLSIPTVSLYSIHPSYMYTVYIYKYQNIYIYNISISIIYIHCESTKKNMIFNIFKTNTGHAAMQPLFFFPTSASDQQRCQRPDGRHNHSLGDTVTRMVHWYPQQENHLVMWQWNVFLINIHIYVYICI